MREVFMNLKASLLGREQGWLKIENRGLCVCTCVEFGGDAAAACSRTTSRLDATRVTLRLDRGEEKAEKKE